LTARGVKRLTVQDTFFTAYQPRTAGRMSAIGQVSDANSKPNAFKGLVLEGSATNAPSLNRPDNLTSTARTAPHSLNQENSSSDADVSTIPQTETSSPQKTSEEENSWSFLDFLDVINPLQHIPVVSSVYRFVTGDEIKSAARILGGAIYGGGVGAAISVANVIVDEATGKDIGENIVAMIKDNGRSITDPNAASKVAENNTNNSINWKYKNDIERPQTIQAQQDSPLLDTPTPTESNRYLTTGMKKLAPQQHSVSVDSPPGIGPHLFSQTGTTLTKEEELLKTRQSNAFPDLQRARARQSEETDQRPELIAQKMLTALDKYSALKKSQMASYQKQYQH